MSSIADAALDGLRRWGAGPDGERLRALMAPRAGADPLARFRRVAQPVVDLPIWLARDVGAGAAATRAAAEAALAGYLYVGLLDGVFDGAAAYPEDGPLAERLFALHRARLAAAGGVDAALFDACWQAFVDGSARRMAATRIDAEYGPADFDASVARARPLALPAAALLDDTDDVAALVELVEHSTRAAQLFDDLVDAEADRAAGRYTGVVRRLGGLDGPETLRRTLHLGGGADSVLGAALVALDDGRAVARRRGWAAVHAGLAAEQTRVRAYRRALAGALAEAIFGGAQHFSREQM